MKKLYIALDGGRKLNIGSLQSFNQKEFKLRTVDINQYQAKISVGLSGDGEDELLYSFLLKDLKAADNGFSYLACQLNREGNKLSLIIKNERKTVCHETFSLVSPLRRRRHYFIGTVIGVMLILLILFFLLFDFSFLFATSKRASSTPVSQINTDSEVILNRSTQSKDIVTQKSLPAETKKESSADIIVSDEISSEFVQDNEKTVESAASPIKTAPRLSLKERSIYFSPNSTRLENNAESALEKILTVLLEYPDLHVIITGHCAIAGTEAGRQEISVQRAENTLAWLKKNGWNPSSTPKVTGEAGNFPLTMNLDEQEINRRVEIEYSN